MQKLPKFVVLSLGAHFILVSSVRFELPQRETAPPPLQARLEPAEPVRIAPPPSPPPPRSQPGARAAKPRSVPHPVAAPPAAAPAREADPVPASDRVTVASEVAPPTPPAPAGADALVADAPQQAAEPAAPAARRLPRKGEITYVVYLGTEKFSVGQTLQAWEINEDTYRLTSVSETTGLVSFFRRERRAYESVGKFTAAGLRPQSFANQRVRSGRTEDARASFDWSTMKVTLGRAQDQKSVALPADAQDLISFMYQLGLKPLPEGRIEVPITNGWKLERYQLDIGPEELLQTPFGTLRALPVKQVRRAGQESIELWLATEYRLLPVKIQFFDRQGERSGEQLVSDIRVSDD